MKLKLILKKKHLQRNKYETLLFLYNCLDRVNILFKLYVNAAEWIGTPYRAGGDSKHGTDCSGLVSQLYKKTYRIRLSRSTDGQLKESNRIARRNLREGDLVFFTSRASRKKVAHVGIYLKDGKFVHASTGQGVIVSSLKEDYYTKHWLCGGRVK